MLKDLYKEIGLSFREGTLIIVIVICFFAGFFGVSILQRIEAKYISAIQYFMHEQSSYFEQIKRQEELINELRLNVNFLIMHIDNQSIARGEYGR